MKRRLATFILKLDLLDIKICHIFHFPPIFLGSKNQNPPTYLFLEYVPLWKHHHLIVILISHPNSTKRTFAWLSSSLQPHWTDASYRGDRPIYTSYQLGATYNSVTCSLCSRCNIQQCYMFTLFRVWHTTVLQVQGVTYNSVTRTGWPVTLCYNNKDCLQW